MAKGQKRSNREIKKPKAGKKVVAGPAAGSVGSAMAKSKPATTPPAKKS